jgi:hypothetical protein
MVTIHFLAEIQAITNGTSVVCGQRCDPNCMMSMGKNSPPSLPPSAFPPPPLNENTHASVTRASALSNSVPLQNADVGNLVDECFAMLSEMDALRDGKILGEIGAADQTNSAPLFLMGLSTTSLPTEVDGTAEGTVLEGAKEGGHFSHIFIVNTTCT